MATIPPPLGEIATEADMEELGGLLPDQETLSPEEILHYHALMSRVSESVTYADMAKRKLE